MAHHIILISFDALRPDALGCYGYSRNVSKNIDVLAQESVIFRNAMTPATWTLPSHMSMLSGLEPPIHGCVSSRYRHPPDVLPFPLIFELIEPAGYVPLAVTGGGYMEAQFGFGRGIDDYRLVLPIRDAMNTVYDHIQSHELTFSFLHTYTVHDYPRVESSPKLLNLLKMRDPNYEGFFPTKEDFHGQVSSMGDRLDPEPISQRDMSYLRDIYDAAVGVADKSLGRFIGKLRETGVWDDVTLILTSDHGEGLGERLGGLQRWHHGGPPYQNQLHIPLLIRPSEEAQGLMEPGDIQQMVSLIDLVPTILDLADEPYSRDAFHGLSLADLCLGQVNAFETRRLHFHSCADAEDRYLDHRLYGSAMTWRESGKILYDPRTLALREYYELDQDPKEQQNRIKELPQEELKRMDEALAAYWARVKEEFLDPPKVEIDDPTVLSRLAALGYLDI